MSVRICPGSHQASCIKGTGSFQRLNGWGVVMTTHSLLGRGYEWVGATLSSPFCVRMGMSWGHIISSYQRGVWRKLAQLD
jgi:hypothetical protein